jgi:hypothetical protein
VHLPSEAVELFAFGVCLCFWFVFVCSAPVHRAKPVTGPIPKGNMLPLCRTLCESRLRRLQKYQSNLVQNRIALLESGVITGKPSAGTDFKRHKNRWEHQVNQRYECRIIPASEVKYDICAARSRLRVCSSLASSHGYGSTSLLY